MVYLVHSGMSRLSNSRLGAFGYSYTPEFATKCRARQPKQAVKKLICDVPEVSYPLNSRDGKKRRMLPNRSTPAVDIRLARLCKDRITYS
jgi:hypothetical protein